jgi:hypothetical protein
MFLMPLPRLPTQDHEYDSALCGVSTVARSMKSLTLHALKHIPN